jgi:hypothetical protein
MQVQLGIQTVAQQQLVMPTLPLGVSGSTSSTTTAGRDHVLRQPPLQVRPQLRGRDGATIRRHHVAHQAPVAERVLAHDDDGLADGGVRGEHGLDLAGLR